jgi:glycosyltransferase involved in cell wall biosynthesis
MRMLVFTSLYPSVARPRHGTFVEARLAAVQRLGGITAHVIAPVPWFPSKNSRFGEYARHALTPREENRIGNRVLHPRYWTLPRAGMYTQPLAMAIAGMGALRKLRRAGHDFDVIDAHYFYPDGVAAAIVARRIGKPLVITARGTDVNLLGDIAWPRRHIMWAARQAREIVTVSSALSDRLVSLGVNADKISVVRNGVDMDTFAPVDRNESRMRLGVESGPLIASIGNLVSEKGHEIVIDALGEMPGLQLVIVGDGPDRRLLESRIAKRGLSERAKVLPARSQAELKWVYGAADAIVIASSREGLPNVLLEAIACGTPVVAARVGGIPEVVTEPVAGRLVDERTPNAFAGAIREVLTAPPSRGATRQFAARFDWATSARGHLAALERAIGKGASAERGLPAQKEIGA